MSKVKVKSKNSMYSGTWPTEFGGVTFNKGIAECTEEQARVLTDRPEFSILTESGDGKQETEKDKKTDPDKLFAEDPEQLDTDQLYEMAKSLDIEGRSKMKKDDLITAIEKAQSKEEEKESSGEDKDNEDEKEGDE